MLAYLWIPRWGTITDPETLTLKGVCINTIKHCRKSINRWQQRRKKTECKPSIGMNKKQRVSVCCPERGCFYGISAYENKVSWHLIGSLSFKWYLDNHACQSSRSNRKTIHQNPLTPCPFKAQVLPQDPETEMDDPDVAGAIYPNCTLLSLTPVPTASASPAGSLGNDVVAPAVAPIACQELSDGTFPRRSQRQNRGKPPDRYGH